MNNLSRIVFCTDIKFCWTKQLFIITCNGPVVFGGRELYALVSHFAGPDSNLTILCLVPWCWKDGLRVLVLHSAIPDSYLTLLWLVPCHLKDERYIYLYYILVDQTVVLHYFHWSRGIWRTGYMCTCITFWWTRQLIYTMLIGGVAFGGREYLYYFPLKQRVI